MFDVFLHGMLFKLRFLRTALFWYIFICRKVLWFFILFSGQRLKNTLKEGVNLEIQDQVSVSFRKKISIVKSL